MPNEINPITNNKLIDRDQQKMKLHIIPSYIICRLDISMIENSQSVPNQLSVTSNMCDIYHNFWVKENVIAYIYLTPDHCI